MKMNQYYSSECQIHFENTTASKKPGDTRPDAGEKKFLANSNKREI